MITKKIKSVNHFYKCAALFKNYCYAALFKDFFKMLIVSLAAQNNKAGGVLHMTGLMHKRSQGFGLGGAKPQITCNNVIRNFGKEGLFMGQRMKDQKLWVWFGTKPGFC